MSVFQCDGPSCVASVEDAYDEDDLLAAGWFLLTMAADEVEKVAHLHSIGCLVEWSVAVQSDGVFDD